MPQNFFRILFIWLTILLVSGFLTTQVNLYYSKKLYSGEYNMNDISTIYIIIGLINLVLKILTLGFGLRHLVRSNNYKVSVGSIFGFAAVFLIIPFLTSTAQIYYYDTTTYGDFISHPPSLYILVLNNFIISLFIVMTTLIMASQWRMFSKAERDGWKSFIPVLNFIEMTQIAKKPVIWAFLLLIPFVNIVVYILLFTALAKVFNKDGLFAVGLMFLPFIFFPILGFGDSKYIYAENEIEEEGLEIEDHLVS